MLGEKVHPPSIDIFNAMERLVKLPVCTVAGLLARAGLRRTGYAGLLEKVEVVCANKRFLRTYQRAHRTETAGTSEDGICRHGFAAVMNDMPVLSANRHTTQELIENIKDWCTPPCQGHLFRLFLLKAVFIVAATPEEALGCRVRKR